VTVSENLRELHAECEIFTRSNGLFTLGQTEGSGKCSARLRNQEMIRRPGFVLENSAFGPENYFRVYRGINLTRILFKRRLLK